MNGDVDRDDIGSISINSAVQHENSKLKKEIKKLKCSGKEIRKLGLEQLNELEGRLQSDLRIIYEVKEKLYKSNFYCIVCGKNQKNVLINQCNHFVLCRKCEKTLEPRKC